MNFKIFQITLILLYGCVFAQSYDSIFVPENQIHYLQLDKIWTNPTQFSHQKFSDFTETNLEVFTKELNIKRVQTAEKSTNYRFNTQGIFNISEKLRVLGSFDYNYLIEKNMGYNLSSGRTEEQFVLNPNYLFVPKASDWETQNYKIKGGLSYVFSKISLGVIADYKNQNSYRISDPRPKINTADYSGKMFAGYQLGKHHFSAFGSLGRKTETHDISSVNEYINAPSNSDYFVRFSNGYGRVIYFSSYSDFIYQTIKRSIGAGYAFSSGKNFFNLNYSYSKDMETLFTKSADGYVYLDDNLEYMKYRTIAYNIDANYWYRADQLEILSNFTLESITGDNYNISEQGQNYKMTLDKAILSNSVIFKDKNKVKLGISLETTYNDLSVIDLLGITYKYLKTLNLKFKSNKDIFVGEKQKLNAELAMSYYFPLSESLVYTSVSSSNALMYDNVITKDHEYDKTQKIGFMSGIRFYQKINSRTILKIFTHLETLFSASNEFKNTDTYNGNPNLILNAGISLYY